jgi:uncharacterized membrane protein YhdT
MPAPEEHGMPPTRKYPPPPSRCRKCGSELRIPRSTISRRARLLMTLSIILFVSGFLVFGYLPLEILGVRVAERFWRFTMAAFMFVSLFFINRMHRVIRLGCYRCGWREDWPVESSNAFESWSDRVKNIRN